MSPRAAWRLEALGFAEVYDYAASKADWFACGQPREGLSTEVPWVGDLVSDDVPTCSPDERVGDVRERVTASGSDLCVVLDGERMGRRNPARRRVEQGRRRAGGRGDGARPEDGPSEQSRRGAPRQEIEPGGQELDRDHLARSA